MAKAKLAPKGTPKRERNGRVRTTKPPKVSGNLAGKLASTLAPPSANGASATARLSKPRAAKPAHPCACGCGLPTKRVFAQGHDAKVYAILRRVRDGEAKQSDVPKGVTSDKALLTHMLTNVS